MKISDAQHRIQKSRDAVAKHRFLVELDHTIVRSTEQAINGIHKEIAFLSDLQAEHPDREESIREVIRAWASLISKLCEFEGSEEQAMRLAAQ